MPTRDVPTPEELVARAETQRLLAELVLGLSEPFRRVVLLRYYEGLSGAEIARALGAPAGTVRWELKEGIDRLRRALDSRFGNDRQTWMLAFAPLAAAPRGSSMVGVVLMTAKMKLAVAFLTLLALCPDGDRMGRATRCCQGSRGSGNLGVSKLVAFPRFKSEPGYRHRVIRCRQERDHACGRKQA